VLGTSLLWRSTVAFTYLKVKPAKCLCLLPVVLAFLRSWKVERSWSSSCKQRSCSWSCYFGLCLGLKNLVLFTSLIILLNVLFPATPYLVWAVEISRAWRRAEQFTIPLLFQQFNIGVYDAFYSRNKFQSAFIVLRLG